ncbi:MAG: hypothetical protein HZA23_03935 [Nitrospirae bacterium]|nr:hypothetical protein [Nitrospirota bacterium]
MKEGNSREAALEERVKRLEEEVRRLRGEIEKIKEEIRGRIIPLDDKLRLPLEKRHERR